MSKKNNTKSVSAKVAKARATRHAVKVAGKGEFPSSFKAFQALRLPVGRHNRFRLQLKAAGKAVFEAGKRSFTFSIVKAA